MADVQLQKTRRLYLDIDLVLQVHLQYLHQINFQHQVLKTCLIKYIKEINVNTFKKECKNIILLMQELLIKNVKTLNIYSVDTRYYNVMTLF